jgi:hypothetical protein
VNTNWLAAAGVIVNAGLVVAVFVPAATVAVAVSTLSAPTKSIFKPLPAKSATPATAFIDAVPVRLPVPVVFVSATLTVESAPVVTTLPNASSIFTTGWVANTTPATVLADGCVVNTNWLAAAAVTVSTCVAEVIVLGEVLAAVIVGVPAFVSV